MVERCIKSEHNNQNLQISGISGYKHHYQLLYMNSICFVHNISANIPLWDVLYWKRRKIPMEITARKSLATRLYYKRNAKCAILITHSLTFLGRWLIKVIDIQITAHLWPLITFQCTRIFRKDGKCLPGPALTLIPLLIPKVNVLHG